MQGMKEWHIPLRRVGSMSLAADPRLTDIIPDKDYTWSITSQHVEPQALTLLTRFGLQALSFQLFPEFFLEGELKRDPDSFSTPPHIQTFTTNTLSLTFAPWEDLKCRLNYWIPASGTAAGEIEVSNPSNTLQEVQFRLASVLRINQSGQQMHAQKQHNRTVLCGKIRDFYPLLFLSGGAHADDAPFPCLSVALSLPPGGRKNLQWILTTETSQPDSFQAAMDLLDHNWQVGYAQSRNLWLGGMQISTGDPEWDLTLALSRKMGLGILSGVDHQGRYQFSNARLDPDQPLPEAKRTTSGPPSLSPLQSYYLADTLSPLDPEILDGLLAGYLAEKSPEYSSDQKPYHPAPFLAQIAWKHSRRGREKEILSTWLPNMQAYLEDWFSTDQDRDQDSVPEWARLDQLDFRSHPSHYSAPGWYQHPHIQTQESPALCALLINEIDCLMNITKALDKTSRTEDLAAKKSILAGHIQRSWNEEQGTYQRWDRDEHTSPPGTNLKAGSGPGLLIINEELTSPARIVVHLRSEKPLSPSTTIFLHGADVDHQHWVERISGPDIHWYLQDGSATSQHVYHFLEYVVLYGIEPDVEIGVYSASFEAHDLLLTLPIRTRAMTKARAQDIIHNKITDAEQYAGKYGLRANPHSAPAQVMLAWNLLIGEGLLHWGERQAAAALMTGIIKAFLTNLGQPAMAYAQHDADSGKAMGGGYQVTGTVPCGFFLHTLGINILSPRTVIVEGINPFPWPVRLSYRGLEVTRNEDATEISFPDGQRIVIQDQHHKHTRVTYR